MRTSLVKGLRDGSFPKKSDSPDDFGKQLTDRLVYRHLQRSGYNYTLSVFAPEAGLHGSEATPNIDDILQMLNVMPGSIAHAQIVSFCVPHRGAQKLIDRQKNQLLRKQSIICNYLSEAIN